MNITFFTPSLKLSGGNIVMFKYAQALAQKGHNVTVTAPANNEIDKIENKVRIKTFKKVPNKYFEHIFFQLIYLNKFFETMPNSDIIIPVFFPLAIHSIYCKKRGKAKKVIALFQDFKDMYWFGKYIYFILKQKFITGNIDDFIAISDPAAQEIQKFTSQNAVIIKNGIEHEYFYPRNTEKENYILFVGSSSKNKGIDYFLKSFEIIKKEFSELKAKIVSPNNENFDNPDIEVVNTGSDRNKLGEIYSKALVYVSQSFGDSFGLPPLEAMACGTATVLTSTTGAKEYARNGENSIIVPVRNEIKTAEAVIQILKNNQLRYQLELNGIKTAQNYDWDKAIEALLRYFKGIRI